MTRWSFPIAPLLIFTGENYDHWQIKMKTFFLSQGLWSVILNGIPAEEDRSSLSEAQLHDLEENERRDKHAMYYIQQTIAPPIFSKICSATSAKTAWEILRNEFQITQDMDYFAIEIPNQLEALCPECCIHGIPTSLCNLNEAAYTPQLVSIGPLHNGEPQLANMEKHKYNYARRFLDRVVLVSPEKDLPSFVDFIRQREERIRRSYIEPSEFDSNKYVKMILLDSFFIFELFIRDQDKNEPEYASDCLQHKLWLTNGIQLDLILFENQIPYTILFELYQFSFKDVKPSSYYPFTYLCSAYFDNFNRQHIILPTEVWNNALHFTDLIRTFKFSHIRVPDSSTKTNTLKYAAKKLLESRVIFQGIEDGTLADINFEKRVLRLPKLKVDNTTERVLPNLMALEQCQYSEDAYICSYVLLLYFLIKSNDDVGVLVEKGVLVNGLGSQQAVADLVNKLCTNIVATTFHFSKICEDLNEHCESWVNRTMAILNGVYFADVWHGTGTILGLFILIYSVINSVWSIAKLITLAIHQIN